MQAQDSEGQMRELIAALQEDTGAVDCQTDDTGGCDGDRV